MKLIAIFLLLLIATSAGAFYVKSGNTVTVPVGSTLEDDLIATGNQISVLGNVNGSVYAAGSSLSITGNVTGPMTAAGNSITVSGRKSTLMLAGRSVQLTSIAAKNIAVAANQVTLDSASKVERDVYLAGNDIRANGTVGRELWLSGASLSIGSNVGGNVHATGQRISVLPGTVVHGNLIYSSPNELKIPSSARILGKVIRRPYTAGRTGPSPFARWLFRFIAMWIFGAVFISIFPRWSVAASQQLMEKPGTSILWGLLILIVVPIVILIAIITLLGIPLAIAALAAYILALEFAGIIVSITVGRLISKNASIWLQLLVGVLVLSILSAIPFLGGLIQFVVILFGLGALALSIRRSRNVQPART